MSDERNSPCPSEDDFPGDMHIALACERCPQLIIACQKYGHAGLASGDLTDEVAHVAELNGLMDMMRENAVDREQRIAELEQQVDDLEAEIARLQWKLGERGLV